MVVSHLSMAHAPRNVPVKTIMTIAQVQQTPLSVDNTTSAPNVNIVTRIDYIDFGPTQIQFHVLNIAFVNPLKIVKEDISVNVVTFLVSLLEIIFVAHVLPWNVRIS